MCALRGEGGVKIHYSHTRRTECEFTQTPPGVSQVVLDEVGLAQKGGSVVTHVQARDWFTTILPTT